jgi:hypothetical protein
LVDNSSLIHKLDAYDATAIRVVSGMLVSTQHRLNMTVHTASQAVHCGKAVSLTAAADKTARGVGAHMLAWPSTIVRRALVNVCFRGAHVMGKHMGIPMLSYSDNASWYWQLPDLQRGCLVKKRSELLATVIQCHRTSSCATCHHQPRQNVL